MKNGLLKNEILKDMKYFCSELNKEFNSPNEMFKALKENESKIVGLKKAQIYESHKKGQLSIVGSYVKGLSQNKAIDFEEGYIYAVINTTRYMDSHKDVHIDGIWKKSLKEQKGNVYYVDGHSLKMDDIIAWKEDVEMFTAMIPWGMVGKSYEGETQALIFKIAKDKIKKQVAIDAIEEKRDVENSVSMIYVKIGLAINSEEKDHEENKALFDEYYPIIANKEVADEFGYCWIIKEAKISREGSMVLAGSNDATGIISVEEPKKDVEEPIVEQPKIGEKGYNYNRLIENLK